ncbi:MAG: hypothetical protein CR986_10380 [Ignavibacteriae bacterium]|nr:MAG: hypothetical protein CR986_10380 [Ignavibacteriota bacterium]
MEKSFELKKLKIDETGLSLKIPSWILIGLLSSPLNCAEIVQAIKTNKSNVNFFIILLPSYLISGSIL